MLLLDAAHHHAEVSRFDHHAHAQRLDRFLNGLGNLHCEPLLHLQAARKYFHQPRNLAQADDLALWDVRDVYFAEERQHMVLAKAEHLDVLHDHHLVVIHAVERALQDQLGILAVALGEVLQRLRVALRGLGQSFSAGLFAETDEHLARQFFKAGASQGRGFNHVFHKSASKYPPAEPEALRLLAPQRGLIATAEKQKQLQRHEAREATGFGKTKATAGGILPEFSKFDCLPGRAGGTPISLVCTHIGSQTWRPWKTWQTSFFVTHKKLRADGPRVQDCNLLRFRRRRIPRLNATYFP